MLPAGRSSPGRIAVVVLIVLTLASCASQPSPDGSASESKAADESPASGLSRQSAEQPGAGAAGPEASPSAQPVPPMDQEELLRTALSLLPHGDVVVRSHGKPLSLFYDLTGDGRQDVALVTVESADTADADLSVLSNFSRMFQSDLTLPEFYLNVYSQAGGEVVSVKRLFLGKKAVFSGIETVRIKRGASLPVAVSAQFYNKDGQQRYWATFSPRGSVSLFVLENTPVMDTVVMDVNEDGLTDVLRYETTFEEGRGYETYITWFGWNGEGYARYKTTNIVRNVNRFLEASRRYLIDERWKLFLDHAVLPQRYSALLEKGQSVADIIERVFTPAPGLAAGPTGDEQHFSFPQKNEVIHDVVFPEILENPFPATGQETSFVAPVRVVCCDGQTSYFTAEIVMQKNPFADRQFFFRIRQ